MEQTRELWVRTDEAEDVAGSIRHALRCMNFVSDDPQAWKWVILALHAALQGACVCHLTTTASPLGAVTRKNASEWLAYFDESRSNTKIKSPKTKLMAFPDLLKEVRKPNSAGDRSNSDGIAIEDSELEWLIRIHCEFRNQFTHFSPTGWSFEVSGVPEIARLTARIIRDILCCGWAFRHLDGEQRETMSRDLTLLSEVKWPIT